jgi:hypothetical protein
VERTEWFAYSDEEFSMRWSLRLMILLITLFGLFSCMAAPAPVMADYGLAYPFRTGAILRYPDFTLTYVGERRVSSDLFPNGFLYHDFSVVTTSANSFYRGQRALFPRTGAV